ncbi:uncharacterized protein LOC142557858 isoform X1 [Dermacentor variabilis]|uniref:uncharacterized protein LOC142557858 isoform X1 n=1 Tax=Dermacentor variabilis TaxID=34621 RepID=UPI003F5BB1A7
MPRCFVTGCRSGYDSVQSSNEKRHFFRPPKTHPRLREWQRAIPRLDKELSSSCVVCDVHFQPEDIVKDFVHNINGEVVAIPRDKWALKEDAVPCLFPNCPKYLSKPSKKRKLPTVRPAREVKRRKKQNGGENENAVPNESDHSERVRSTDDAVAIESPASLFAELSTIAKAGERVEGWSTEAVDDTVVLFKLVLENAIPRIEKAVTISSDLELTVSANGLLVPSSIYATNTSVQRTSLRDLKYLLSYTDQMKPCEGIPAKLYPEIESSTVATKGGETWRRKTCTVISLNTTCPECKMLSKLFMDRMKKRQHRKPRQRSICLKPLRRKAIRATLKREKLKHELAVVKNSLHNITEAKIDSALHILPAKQQLLFKTALMASRARAKKGRRYDNEWLMTCLFLRISSPKAYTLISDMELLPLPSKARLQQIISGIPCRFGFNEVALRNIKLHFHDKDQLKQYGVLLLDEIKLKQAVAFNKASCRMDGFVDYGDLKAENPNQLADHALVLMFVPLFEGWVQPIASFTTRGAAPGRILSELVLSAILELRKNNASVLAVISDGAGNNKSMWSHFGLSGKLHSARHYIENPWDLSQKIYFVCDVPHIMKCIRNHLQKHNYGMVRNNTVVIVLSFNILFFFQAGHHQINFKHYSALYEAEKDKYVRVVPKLSKVHVAPDNLRKQSVRLATQLFSRGTAIGIRVYREAKAAGMEDSEGTETFTMMLNDLFDALNTKLPARGVRRHSKEIQVIKDFLELLNVTEQNAIQKNLKLFASQQTTESLRVTLMSTLDIVDDLLRQGALYVLTAKLNQDPLERHFGLVRSFGGDESHPTITNFTQIFRLLSLYTPVKAALRGSVEGVPSPVLVGVNDTFQQTREACKSKQSSLRSAIEASLISCLEPSSSPDCACNEHTYARGNIEDNVVYYLCGYIIHKVRKGAPCDLCIADISSETPAVGCDSYLTEYRSFKQGSLKHPTPKMLGFMKTANKSVSASLDEAGLCGDIFWKVLDDLEGCCLPLLGCTEHMFAFTCEVLNFFIVMRMHFYSRDINCQLESSHKVSVATKKARLL